MYSTVGVRPEADFFLWSISERYDDLLELGAALNGTPLAAWLTTPHSYLGTTKPSVYTDKKRVRQGRVAPRNAPYLVVYPFVKRRPWYFLTFEERASAMREHAEVGGKFVTITNHTTYSFGIDDQEFIPAFEAEEPADFMHLMMTLRETEASRWTERDTPIFVGKLVDVRVALDALDGAVDGGPERRDALHGARRHAVSGARALRDGRSTPRIGGIRREPGGRHGVSPEELGNPSSDGLGALNVQEMPDAIDHAVLDVRHRGAEEGGDLYPQRLGLAPQHGENGLMDGGCLPRVERPLGHRGELDAEEGVGVPDRLRRDAGDRAPRAGSRTTPSRGR